MGFLNINKPAGMTSHDVVARVRRKLVVKKVGHAGTLDPMATGVLILCLGAATRLSEYVMHATKRYRARVHLGVTTETYDAEGTVLSQQDSSAVARADVDSVLAPFLGEIEQIPPMYSAIKHEGRQLYKLARAGKTVERDARKVMVEALDLVDWSPPFFTLDVVCSAGTYIRSLAYDLGEALGVGAHLAGLQRLASGSLMLDTAISLDTLLHTENWRQYLIPPQNALPDWLSIHLNADDTDSIVHGRTISNKGTTEGNLALAFGPQGELIAVVKSASGLWRPEKVLV
jgi:tRNA pseudouridine55 synthase